MRGSAHSREFRTYDLTDDGVKLRESLRDYDGVITGMPTRQLRIPPPPHPGLVEREVAVLEMLMRSEAMTAADVATQTGLPRNAADAILERLVLLDYAGGKGSRFTAPPRPNHS
jgi:hypothetical protein